MLHQSTLPGYTSIIVYDIFSPIISGAVQFGSGAYSVHPAITGDPALYMAG